MFEMSEEPKRRGTLLDFIFGANEGISGDVKGKRGPGCSDHELVEFRTPRGGREVKGKLTTMDFRRAGCLEESCELCHLAYDSLENTELS